MTTDIITKAMWKSVSIACATVLGLVAKGSCLAVGIAGEIVCGVFRFFLAVTIALLSFAASIALFIWLLTL